MDARMPILQEGKDVFCICLTANFSGSYQSGVNAANILSEAYPERKIIVLDSACVTGSQGLLVYEACRMRDAGYSMEELLSVLDKQKYMTKINFTVDSLDYLQKGGRIGKAARSGRRDSEYQADYRHARWRTVSRKQGARA